MACMGPVRRDTAARAPIKARRVRQRPRSQSQTQPSSCGAPPVSPSPRCTRQSVLMHSGRDCCSPLEPMAPRQPDRMTYRGTRAWCTPQCAFARVRTTDAVGISWNLLESLGVPETVDMPWAGPDGEWVGSSRRGGQIGGRSAVGTRRGPPGSAALCRRRIRRRMGKRQAERLCVSPPGSAPALPAFPAHTAQELPSIGQIGTNHVLLTFRRGDVRLWEDDVRKFFSLRRPVGQS